MKLIMRLLVTILFAGLLYSQSPSDMEQISKDIDDLGSELRNLSRTYSDGSAGGIQLNEAQLDEVRVLWGAKFDLVKEVAGCDEYFADAEIVFVEALKPIDPQVFALLEFLLRTDMKIDEGIVFYYKNRSKNEQRVRDIISLLRPETE